MIHTALNDIADRLAKLAPSHRDPQRYFEEKSELVNQLRRLAESGKSLSTFSTGGKILPTSSTGQRRTAA